MYASIQYLLLFVRHAPWHNTGTFASQLLSRVKQTRSHRASGPFSQTELC